VTCRGKGRSARRLIQDVSVGRARDVHGNRPSYALERSAAGRPHANPAAFLDCCGWVKVVFVRSILVACAVVLGAPGLARARPSSAEGIFSASIEYVAPSSCPSSADFKAVVVERLSFDPFSADAPEHVLVLITEGPRALEGRLEWRNENGEWTGDQAFPAHTNDCAALVRAMGFALAVQINLLTTGRPPAAPRARPPAGAAGAPPKKNPSGPPERASPAKAAPAGTTSEPRTNETPAGALWEFAVGAGGSLGVGLSPEPTALGRVFGSVARGPASLELGAELSTLSAHHREDGAGFNQWVMLASAAACGTEGPWSLCLLVKGGVMKVSGQGVDVPASPTGPTWQAGLRLGARQRFSSIFFAERLEGLANLARSTVTIDQVPLWRMPTFAGTIGLDVGVIFQ